MDEGGQTRVAARKWQVLGFVLIGAAGVYAVANSLVLGLWRQNSPGEGLFPFIAAMAVTAFSALGLAAALLRTGDDSLRSAETEGGLRSALLRVAAYLAALIFYAAVLDALGFITSTILVVVFILKIAEGYGWLATVALAAGTSVACHALFVTALGALLPTGHLWDRMFY